MTSEEVFTPESIHEDYSVMQILYLNEQHRRMTDGHYELLEETRNMAESVTILRERQRFREIIDKYTCCDGEVLDLGPSTLSSMFEELNL